MGKTQVQDADVSWSLGHSHVTVFAGHAVIPASTVL